MKIAIIGAGALGCLFGGRLAAAGHDIWLLHHRPEPARRLDQHGIQITDETDRETVDVAATTNANNVGTAELVLVLVRAHQTASALADHEACIGPDTLVFSPQNGLRTDEHLLEHVHEDRALYGITYEAAVQEQPGHVRHSSAGETIVGGATADARTTVRSVLTDAGFDVTITDHPRRTVWQKGVFVASTAPILTITGQPVAALTREPLSTVVGQLLDEAARVATVRGIEIDTDAIQETLAKMADTHNSHEVSMAQDIEHGRRTEIDELNGAIVTYGEETDTPVPVNRSIAALVRGHETRQ